MKKLMTALATAATALFAIGAANGDEAPLNATSFEELTLNSQLDTLADDTGDTEGETKYWYMATTDADNGTLVTNEVAGAGVSRPDYFAKQNQANTQALALDTSSPLFRHMGTSDGQIPATGESIGDGIYLDTLVKFTAADDVFGDDALGDDDKIAISYVEQSDDVADPITNFVIRAGYIAANEVTKKNYVATLPAGAEFDKDAWHRLTVRTITNIDGDNHVGFAVYVDQTALVYADAEESIGEDVELVGIAATLANAIYPSAVYTGDAKTTITAASFSGTGAIDDVVFTRVMPDFIAASSAVPVSITLGTGVTGVTVTVDEETINPVDATATPLVFNLPAGTTSFDLAGTLDTGYQNLTAVFAEEDVTSTFDNGTVSFQGVSLAFTVKASRNNFNVFDAQGQQSDGIYETLSQALADPNAAKIQLAYDYDVLTSETVSDSLPVYTISKDVVLDLNGKTLDGGSSNVRFLFATATDVELTVIDSVEGDDGKIVYGGTYGIFGGDGDVYIGSTELTDYGVVVDGSLIGEEMGYVTEIVRGKFSAVDNTVEDDVTGDQYFIYYSEPDDILNLNSTSALVGTYWVVTYGGEEPPTPAEVNFSVEAANEHSSVVIKIDNVVVAFADLPEKLTEGQTYEVTYTADEGYHFVTEQGNQTSIVVSGTVAKADITITAPTAEQDIIGTYTVNVTPNANATYAAAYKVGGETITPENDVLTVTVGQTIVITATPAEDYEYAEAPTGWTAGQDGEITIEVSEAGTVAIPAPTEKQQGEYPSYIKDETAQGKYDTWKSYVEGASETVGDGEALEDAYLLNCKPSEVTAAKAAFKFTSISYDATEEKWVTTTTTGYNEREYNGTVTVKQYSDVGCKTESATGTFFKAVLQ